MQITITNKWSKEIPFSHGQSIRIFFDKSYFAIRISTPFHGTYQTEVHETIDGVFEIPAAVLEPYVNPSISFKADREEEINITVEFI